MHPESLNAFEAIEDGGSFKVSVSNEDDSVVVEFEDDGSGIREEDIPRIFSPFFTTHDMGTGLGLSVVHNIISAHEGEVSVKSQPGKWTIFRVALPAAPDQSN